MVSCVCISLCIFCSVGEVVVLFLLVGVWILCVSKISMWFSVLLCVSWFLCWCKVRKVWWMVCVRSMLLCRVWLKEVKCDMVGNCRCLVMVDN